MFVDKIDSLRNYILGITKGFFEKHFMENSQNMSESFEEAFTKQLEQYELKDDSEVEGIRRLIVSFRPALSSVLQPCAEFDALMTMLQMTLQASWEGAHRRKKKPERKQRGLVMPGSDQSVNLSFFCAVCGKEIDVPDPKTSTGVPLTFWDKLDLSEKSKKPKISSEGDK